MRLLTALFILLLGSAAAGEEPLRIAVIGLTHGHVEGLLWNARERDDLEIVGVFEKDRDLFDRMARKYTLDPALRYSDLGRMLDETAPEAASVMTGTRDHLEAVEACAPRGVHVLVEKPLDFDLDRAERMAELARRHGILLLTNFETSWYRSVREAGSLLSDAQIRRAVFRHGHKGPIEIGCSSEFLEWLTDPRENGGGAITDFGCYGAVLMTWLMDGQRPLSVTASAQTLKPDLYPEVDDDATIILTYPDATAVIQASWAWTHDNKEMDIHAEGVSLHAGKWNDLTRRAPDAEPEPIDPAPMPAHLENEWTYLREVVRGRCEVDPLSSLELNLIAAEILDAARESAEDGETVRLRERRR